jgi:hypothetical protein
MAGVAAMVLVIAVVLISVIYPSKVAARIAIPDINQTFQLPAAVNNTIELTLPFLLKPHEYESVGAFIYTYLQGHQDISHGLFSTGPVDVQLYCSTDDEFSKSGKTESDPRWLHISTKVWLAPFDFGIMQHVDIGFRPTRDNDDFLEIQLSLTRFSGESGVWRRINKSFLHELRKQLLIWRSIDSETHGELERLFRNTIAKKMEKYE